jgi:hypothetical protein
MPDSDDIMGISAGLAGPVAAVITTPIDVVMKLMMPSVETDGEGVSNATEEILRQAEIKSRNATAEMITA